jgi:hypothetical protein
LLRLERDGDIAPGNRGFDLLASLADHDNSLVRPERVDPIE